MSLKDNKGESRDGSSRVSVQRATELTHCLTLEVNYHNGKRINALAPKLIKAQGCIEEETPVTDPKSKLYAHSSNTQPAFTEEIFLDVGNAVAVALLDQIGVNPVSRIPLSAYKAVANVRDDIMNNLEQYSTGHINVCGANCFSNSNSKVARLYEKTEAPTVKKTSNG